VLLRERILDTKRVKTQTSFRKHPETSYCYYDADLFCLKGKGDEIQFQFV
jgi:hypothetical protein